MSDDAGTFSDDADRRAPKRGQPPNSLSSDQTQNDSDESAECARFVLAKTLLTAQKRSRRNFDLPFNGDGEGESSESRYS